MIYYYPASSKPCGAVRSLEHRIISVTAWLMDPRLDSLYAICRLRHAFWSVSAVRESNEKPTGGGSFSEITLQKV